MIKNISTLLLIIATMVATAQQKEFKCTPEWVHKIEQIAPAKAEVQPKKQEKY